jgi:hypothetical protein
MQVKEVVLVAAVTESTGDKRPASQRGPDILFLKRGRSSELISRLPEYDSCVLLIGQVPWCLPHNMVASQVVGGEIRWSAHHFTEYFAIKESTDHEVPRLVRRW